MGEKKSDSAARREMGERIKEFAEAEYKRQSAFADVIGRSPGQVGDWTSGRKSPTLDVLYEIQEKTGMSVDWVMTGRGPRKVAPKSTGTDMSDAQDFDADRDMIFEDLETELAKALARLKQREAMKKEEDQKQSEEEQ